MVSQKLSPEALQQKAKKIKLVALDMDGTLTDGSINIGGEGELFKRFNAKDGLGITAARRHGLRVAVITGRKGAIAQRRAEELGIAEDVMTGISAKRKALQALAEKYKLSLAEIAFMGDDLNDLPALKIAGLSAAPADATEDVKQRVEYITPHKGGRGAVRDLLELILKARGSPGHLGCHCGRIYRRRKRGPTIMLYAVLKTLSWLASHTPYKVLVKIGKGLGHLYWHIAKKQRIRAEETIRERLGYSRLQAKETIRRLFVNLGISVMEMLYMPALNKDNIRGLVTFDHPEILWEALKQKKGVPIS